MIVSLKDKAIVEAAVKAAELGTSGEIVPVVSPASGDYSGIAHRLGILGFLLGSAFAFWMHHRYPFTELSYLFGLQCIGAALGWSVGHIPCVLRACLGSKRLEHEVHEAALASFTRHGLHQTREETGILIFVSLLERRVEILADRGIHQKLGDNFWKIELQKLTLGIREKRAAGAMAEVILEMGRKLHEHFPRRDDDTDELSNELQSN